MVQRCRAIGWKPGVAKKQELLDARAFDNCIVSSVAVRRWRVSGIVRASLYPLVLGLWQAFFEGNINTRSKGKADQNSTSFITREDQRPRPSTGSRPHRRNSCKDERKGLRVEDRSHSLDDGRNPLYDLVEYDM